MVADLPPEFDLWGQTKPLEVVELPTGSLRLGDRVRLKPAGRADIFDMTLAGMVGVVESIEQDMDDLVQLAVVLESDPGRDLGELRQPGHRFFFRTDEVEPL